MVEAVTRLLGAQMVKVERTAAILRIASFLGLSALLAALRSPRDALTVHHLLAFLAFLLGIVVSVRATRTATFLLLAILLAPVAVLPFLKLRISSVYRQDVLEYAPELPAPGQGIWLP